MFMDRFPAKNPADGVSGQVATVKNGALKAPAERAPPHSSIKMACR
jgi:hypothetical protein